VVVKDVVAWGFAVPTIELLLRDDGWVGTRRLRMEFSKKPLARWSLESAVGASEFEAACCSRERD